MSANGTQVSVAGWAADADVGGAAIAVHVYADGNGAAVIQAHGSRPDVDAATGLGANHGFGATFELGPGDHQVCAYAINDGAGEENTLLGCRVVAVRTTPPVGALDRLVASGSGAFIEGWTADPDLPGAVLDVHVYVDGQGAAITRAGSSRPDVDAGTGFGLAHGFSTPVPMTGGVHQVCVYAITPQPAEGNSLLACQLVWALGSSPAGVVDVAAGDGRSVVVAGWAVDGDLPDQALDVHVYVDGAGTAVTIADRERADVAGVFGVGPRHGFAVRVPAVVGRHDVCAYAIAAQAGDPNTLLGCRSVNVIGASPVGSLDVVRGVGGELVGVEGWAADPDDPTVATDVHLYLDGRGVAVLRADADRPDVGAATPYGPTHGFGAILTTTSGVHELCAYAIAFEAGESNTLLGCRTVTVDGPAGL